MPTLSQKIEQAAATVLALWPNKPRVGIVLGTGLTRLADELEDATKFDYNALPHFPRATAPSHRGQLVCGELAGQSVLMMDGRFHAYEGYSSVETTFPIRVMRRLGIELLILSNASGGLNPRFSAGDVMIVEDHINWIATNPLVGQNHETVGPRTPDLSRAYDFELAQLARQVGLDEEISLQQGVYAGVTGPNYETRAEYRFLRRLGADAVGMSTVPEAIVAAHCGLRVLALSTVTNMCLPDALTPTHCEDVVAAAEQAQENVKRIVRGVVKGSAKQREPTHRIIAPKYHRDSATRQSESL